MGEAKGREIKPKIKFFDWCFLERWESSFHQSYISQVSPAYIWGEEKLILDSSARCGYLCERQLCCCPQRGLALVTNLYGHMWYQVCVFMLKRSLLHQCTGHSQANPSSAEEIRWSPVLQLIRECTTMCTRPDVWSCTSGDGDTLLSSRLFSGDGFVSGCLDLYCRPGERDTDTETDVEVTL